MRVMKCVGQLPLFLSFYYREIEQMVARQAHNLKAAGSSPALATNMARRCSANIV